MAQQPFAGRRIHEHRLILDVNLRQSCGGFNFWDRNRLEHHARHSSVDFTVYRNRLQLDHPVRLGDFKFSAYGADEVFYSTQRTNGVRQSWVRNRLGGGVFKQFNEWFYGELFYLHQNDGVARPGNVHAAGDDGPFQPQVSRIVIGCRGAETFCDSLGCAKFFGRTVFLVR